MDLRSCPVWIRPELELYKGDLWMFGCMSPWTHIGWVSSLGTADIGAGHWEGFAVFLAPLHSIVTTIDVPEHCVPVHLYAGLPSIENDNVCLL